MLSQVMFGKIDQRLRQAKNNNELLGGLSIILIGKAKIISNLTQKFLIKFFC